MLTPNIRYIHTLVLILNVLYKQIIQVPYDISFLWCRRVMVMDFSCGYNALICGGRQGAAMLIWRCSK